jgi:protein SCO1/2
VNKGLLYTLIAIGLLAAGVAAFSLGRVLSPAPAPVGTVLQNPIAVSDVALLAEGDRQVTLADYDDSILAVFFGFTRCPDECPLTMARLADAYRDLGEPAGLRVMMVTVDPGFDTPEMVQAYAAGFHPDFVGLGGSNEQIAAAAAKFFVGYNDSKQGVIHTDTVMLVDRQGRFRQFYSADRLPGFTADLRAILAARNW